MQKPKYSAEGEQQVIDGYIIDETDDRANDHRLLTNNRKEDGNGYTDSNSITAKRTDRV